MYPATTCARDPWDLSISFHHHAWGGAKSVALHQRRMADMTYTIQHLFGEVMPPLWDYQNSWTLTWCSFTVIGKMHVFLILQLHSFIWLRLAMCVCVCVCACGCVGVCVWITCSERYTENQGPEQGYSCWNPASGADSSSLRTCFL